MTATAPPLGPELLAGLRRLKLATIRAQAPEVLQTARTQRWAPEEVLRTLVAAEIVARDEGNQRLRLKAAGFPVLKQLDEFDTLASSIPAPTFAYLASLEWVRARENLLLVGPAGTGKSHVLIGVGMRAVEHGLRVRYATAADLIVGRDRRLTPIDRRYAAVRLKLIEIKRPAHDGATSGGFRKTGVPIGNAG